MFPWTNLGRPKRETPERSCKWGQWDVKIRPRRNLRGGTGVETEPGQETPPRV